ncbi:MAG: DNA primase [Hydrogenothermus sp.]|nr:MAG: DNA primase [Hydrogenothermus sp.]
MAILPETIEEVKSVANVYDVISEYLDLKKVGTSYSALCPFHSEKTPSFYVSPQKNIWKCFGCGKSGNAISFLVEYEGISYSQAIIKLAEKYNIQVKFSSKDNFKEKSKILTVLEKVAKFYKQQLKNYPKPRRYLLERGINPSTIDKFDIGYSPEDDSFIKFVEKENIDKKILVDAGIISSIDSKKDKFSGRIIFPIKDLSGRVIAFGGRVIDDNKSPKYLNSPETKVYHKSEVLYGLYEAKEHIREENFAVIVEGYFDVISPYQVGLKNIVASLGTAFTQKQAKLLKKFTDKIYLMFDSDKAGKQAVIRASKIFLSEGIQVYYVPLEDKDPDLLAKKGYKALREKLQKGENFLDFLIKTWKNTKSREKRASLMKIVLDILSTAKDKIIVSEYVNILSKETGMLKEFLIEEMKKFKSNKTITKDEEEVFIKKDKLNTAEKIVLKGLITLDKNQVLNILNNYGKIVSSEYFNYLMDAILNNELSEKEYEEIKSFETSPITLETFEDAISSLIKLNQEKQLKEKAIIFGNTSEETLMEIYKLKKSLIGG